MAPSGSRPWPVRVYMLYLLGFDTNFTMLSGPGLSGPGLSLAPAGA